MILWMGKQPIFSRLDARDGPDQTKTQGKT